MTYHKGWRERTAHTLSDAAVSVENFFSLYFDLLFSIIFEHPAIKRKVIFHLILDLCKSIIHVMNNYTFIRTSVCTHACSFDRQPCLLAFRRVPSFLMLFSCCLTFSSAEAFFLRFLFSPIPCDVSTSFEIWIWLVFGIVFFSRSFFNSFTIVFEIIIFWFSSIPNYADRTKN